jgi:hypothetical protein
MVVRQQLEAPLIYSLALLFIVSSNFISIFGDSVRLVECPIRAMKEGQLSAVFVTTTAPLISSDPSNA